MHRTFFASRWRLCSAHQRRLYFCHHGLGLMEVLTSALLYIHLFTRFHLPQAPLVRQATPSAVSSSIDLSDAFEVLLEFDD